jgi:hypothetical protein
MKVSQIAQAAGLQRMAITRIKADPTAAEAMLRNWALSVDEYSRPCGAPQPLAAALAFSASVWALVN